MPRGRPKKNIDLDAVRELASEGNTQEDIASALGFARSTFGNRPDLKEAYQLGLAELRVNLRHWQVQAAKSGNIQMLIHLGKVLLNQSDTQIEKAEMTQEDDPITKSLNEEFGEGAF